ncbi:MAG: ABC transporter permease [Oscillospiraceae bacterium]|nr:ABC transporter permease [Oscillospiraceae bacterium]
MISMPLFWQSMKANWGIWTVITVATCFMLALIVMVTGGSSINVILGSVADSFIKDSAQAEVKGAAMSQYYLARLSLEGYEEGVDRLGPTFSEDGLIASVADGVASGVAASMAAKGADPDEAAARAAEARSFSRYVLAEYAAVRGQLPYVEAVGTFLPSLVVGTLGATMPARLLTGGLSAGQLTEYGLWDEGIAEMAGEAITVFRAVVGVRYPEGEYAGYGAIAAAHPDAVDGVIAGLTASLMEGLPESAKDNMADMQAFDLTQFLTGTIFFKIAGLLLPVIYIIMVSISLIAGQVDSGSMAYVVSTPTRRVTVTLTQAAFLVSSLLAMCSLMAATGLICLAAVGDSSITLAQMALLNLSSFATMFAFAGICFLASAWFNRGKHAMAIGGGVSMYFVVATIMGMFGSPEMPGLIRMDAMDAFNYTTITGFFDGSSILAGTADFVPKLAALAAIGLTCFAVGMVRFSRKDLPL